MLNIAEMKCIFQYILYLISKHFVQIAGSTLIHFINYANKYIIKYNTTLVVHNVIMVNNMLLWRGLLYK